MDSYRLNCAIVVPASCGLIGVAVATLLKLLGFAPVVTPTMISVFAWWPADTLYSGALVGGVCGVLCAALAITADMSHEATMRDFALRRI